MTRKDYVKKELTKIVEYDKNEWTPVNRIAFEYTDISISEIRYAWMMNAFAMEETNASYIYNWY